MSKQLLQQALEDAITLRKRYEDLIMQTSELGNVAIEALRAALDAPVEPVGKQYQSRDGTWHPFLSEKHAADTILDGTWPVRNIYSTPPDAEALRKELERVKGERDAMALDAERYRYIRDTDNGEFGSLFIGVDSSQYPSRWALSEDEADKAIDAAIAAQGGKV